MENKKPNKLHEPVELWVSVFFFGSLIVVPLIITLIARNADYIDSYFTRLFSLIVPRILLGLGVIFAVVYGFRRFRQGHN